MDRHDVDLVALVAGASFTLLAITFVADGWTWFGMDAQWGLALLLVGLGIAAMTSAVTRTREARASNGTSPVASSRILPEPPHDSTSGNVDLV